jgi:hypothetical protein
MGSRTKFEKVLLMLEYTELTGESCLLRSEEPINAYRKVSAWIDTHLAHSHPFGQRGRICPGLPLSIERSALWFAHIVLKKSKAEAVKQILPWARRFIETPPTTSPEKDVKAIILVLPHFEDHERGLLQEIKNASKPYFVRCGLMLGTFNPRADRYDSENDWPPRSPIPIIAVRHMIQSDYRFLGTSKMCRREYESRFGEPKKWPELRRDLP